MPGTSLPALRQMAPLAWPTASGSTWDPNVDVLALHGHDVNPREVGEDVVDARLLEQAPPVLVEEAWR